MFCRAIVSLDAPGAKPVQTGRCCRLPFGKKPGAPARTRTWNQLIKSQLLYQLSYRGTAQNKKSESRKLSISRPDLARARTDRTRARTVFASRGMARLDAVFIPAQLRLA